MSPKSLKGKKKTEAVLEQQVETYSAELEKKAEPVEGDELPSFSKMDEEDLNEVDEETAETIDRPFDGKLS